MRTYLPDISAKSKVQNDMYSILSFKKQDKYDYVLIHLCFQKETLEGSMKINKNY